jgi:hypothetical protein
MKTEDTSQAFVQYYKNLFTTCEPIGVDRCLTNMEAHVIADMNRQLFKEFTLEGSMQCSHKSIH